MTNAPNHSTRRALDLVIAFVLLLAMFPTAPVSPIVVTVVTGLVVAAEVVMLALLIARFKNRK